jgi:IS30 family transposase
MRYCRLTQGERYQIAALLETGRSIRAIAGQLKRAPSSILRETLKGQINGKYDALFAHQVTEIHLHRPLLRRRKIQGVVEDYVREKLEEDWSPEQICGRMRLLKMQSVSCPTIYRYIEREKVLKGRLWTHLRILRRKHKNRKLPGWNRRVFLPDRVSIQERPLEVEKRTRLGDYERDTVLGKRGKSVLLTAVDRTSRLLKLAWLPKSTAEAAHQATVLLLKNEPVKTITNDNGFEFSFHNKTAQKQGASIYFSSSFRAWERGTNENTNGLLRQYFPKKKDIGTLSKEKVTAISKRLNNRPRKILGYKTPLEIHSELKSSAVALGP